MHVGIFVPDMKNMFDVLRNIKNKMFFKYVV